MKRRSLGRFKLGRTEVHIGAFYSIGLGFDFNSSFGWVYLGPIQFLIIYSGT